MSHIDRVEVAHSYMAQGATETVTLCSNVDDDETAMQVASELRDALVLIRRNRYSSGVEKRSIGPSGAAEGEGHAQ